MTTQIAPVTDVVRTHFSFRHNQCSKNITTEQMHVKPIQLLGIFYYDFQLAGDQ